MIVGLLDAFFLGGFWVEGFGVLWLERLRCLGLRVSLRLWA